jgi:hypothetical protein
MTDEIINIVLVTLRSFTYVSISTAAVVQWRRLGNSRSMLDSLLFFVVLVAAAAFYNNIMDSGVEAFKSMTENADKKIDIYLTSAANFELSEDTGFLNNVIISLQATTIRCVLYCCKALRYVSDYLQQFLVIAFKVLAPIVIGLGAWEVFRHTLWKFILYSLAAAMWSVGYVIADVFILKGASIFGIPPGLKAGATVVVAGGEMAMALLSFGIALLISMSIFYILTPLILFSVLSGVNPASAVTGNMRTATLGTMGFSRTAGQIASRLSQGGASSSSSSAPPPLSPAASSINGKPSTAARIKEGVARAMRS